MASNIEITVPWDMTVSCNRDIARICCLHFWGRKWWLQVLLNISIYLTDRALSHPKKQ